MKRLKVVSVSIIGYLLMVLIIVTFGGERVDWLRDWYPLGLLFIEVNLFSWLLFRPYLKDGEVNDGS